MKLRSDRVDVSDEWIGRVIAAPAARIVQEDGRIRLWGEISGMDNRYLRVILLEDGQTVHNAVFDRRYRHHES